MSKFTTDLVNAISPYVPGEQPRDRRYIKLNTNENPYFTSKYAVEALNKEDLFLLNRYSDPENRTLCEAIANYYGVDYDNVLVTNGSDEALAFCFMAYGSGGICYPDVTYGFYDVIANLFCFKIEHVNLNEDFEIDNKKFCKKDKTIVIANPNAQTGILLDKENLEGIIADNANNITIVDQAYADFSDYNCIPLIGKYKNLVTINTFSKSRSLAGARVGYVIAQSELIDDLKKIKNSFHPYNVNSLSAKLATQAVKDEDYFKCSVQKIIKTRKKFTQFLRECGFKVLPSSANFVLAEHSKITGRDLYCKLKEKGVLVRHLSDERIENFIRITIGTEEEMTTMSDIIKLIITEYRYEICRNKQKND